MAYHAAIPKQDEVDVHDTSGTDTPPQANTSDMDGAAPVTQPPEAGGPVVDPGTAFQPLPPNSEEPPDTMPRRELDPAPVATVPSEPAVLPATTSDIADPAPVGVPGPVEPPVTPSANGSPAPSVVVPEPVADEQAASPAASATPAPPPDPIAATAQVDATTADDPAPSSTPSGDEVDVDAAEVDADGPALMDTEQLAALARIEKRLDELVRLGDRNADHVGALHSENQRLRNGEIQTALNAHIRDVIRVYDDVVRLTGTGSPAEGDLRIVGDLLVGTLGRWGVERFEPTVGDPFDTSVHSGVGRVPANDQASNTIAGVRRCGFRSAEGKTIRTADVEVFWQVESAVPPTDNPPAPTAPASTQEVEP